MTPKPRSSDPKHWGSGKLDGKRAIITGVDSGIGRAVAIAFARENAVAAFVTWTSTTARGKRHASSGPRVVAAKRTPEILANGGSARRSA